MSDAEPSARPLESALFGCRVLSASVTTAADVDAAVDAITADADTLLVARVPATQRDAVWRLEEQGARLCDVLLTLTREVAPAHVAQSGGGVVRRGTADDASALAALSLDAFSEFRGHWHADDRLPRRLADQLYANWTADLARSASDERPLLVATTSAGEHAGFLAIAQYGPNRWHVPLTAVAPRHRGAGTLRAMLDAAIAEIARHGAGSLDYETQVTNLPALRTVARLGFLPATSRLTFHLWARSR